MRRDSCVLRWIRMAAALPLAVALVLAPVGLLSAGAPQAIGVVNFPCGPLYARREDGCRIRAAEGEADFISSDCRDASSAREVARRAVQLGNGHVDILINSAGIFPFGPTHEATEELFDDVYSLNVKAPYFLVAELAPLMARRGKGAIVNVSTKARVSSN